MPTEENKQIIAEEVEQTDANTQGAAKEEPENKAKTPTVKDILNSKEGTAEIDKRIAKALETARSRWETEASLTAEQKAAKALADKEAELQERQAEFDKREFVVDLKDELTRLKLPVSFAEIIANGSNREEYSGLLSEIKKTWDLEMAEALKASARQTAPSVGATNTEATNKMRSLKELADKHRKVN